MTSMFATTTAATTTTRLNHLHQHQQQSKNEEPREVQSKKQALQSLEVALKKRIQELKELCLKEGELTGHLPIDYPLQPREPIPQVRRRANANLRHTTNHDSIDGSSGSTKDTNSIISSTSSSSSLTHQQQQQIIRSQRNHHLLNGVNSLPTRPTSTQSTSSSLSTASSNTRTASNLALPNGHGQYQPTKPIPTSYSHPSSLGSDHLFKEPQLPMASEPKEYKFQSFRYDPSLLPNQFKKHLRNHLPNTSTSNNPNQQNDNDVQLGYIRASSTTSSASSSGSAASSTLSAPVALSSQFKVPYAMVNSNLHFRSCSETIENPHSQSSTSSDTKQTATMGRKQQATSGVRFHDIENSNNHNNNKHLVTSSNAHEFKPQHLIRKTTSTSSSSSLVSTSSCPPQPMRHQNHLQPSQQQQQQQQQQPPVRPPRGLNHNGLSHHHHASAESVNGVAVRKEHRHPQEQQRQFPENKPVRSAASANDVNGQTLTTISATKDNAISKQQQQPLHSQLFNIDEVTKFQPYYEETKPFQMSDFYKYSAKHRNNHKMEPHSPLQLKNNGNVKTTRQLQEEVAKTKTSLKLDKCDDQIQASVKLIEKSGQKLFKATAKALAGNPHLADKLNNIIPATGNSIKDHNHHRIRRD